MSSNEQLNTIIAKMEEDSIQHMLNIILNQLQWMEDNLYRLTYKSEFHKLIFCDYIEVVRRLVESRKILNPDRELQDWELIHNTRYYDSVKGTCNEMYALIKFNEFSQTTKCYISISEKSDQVKGKDLVVYNQGWPREYVVQVKTGVKNEFGVIKVFTDWLSYDTVDRLAISNYEQQFCWMMDYPKFKSWIENNHDVYGDVTSRHYIIPASEIKSNGHLFNFMDLS